LAASPDINVYFLNAHTSFTAADVAAIKVSFYFCHITMFKLDERLHCIWESTNRSNFFQTFVKNGGGLLVAGQAWAWAYYSGEWSDKVQFANGYPGNK